MNFNEAIFNLRRWAYSPWGDRTWEVVPGEFYRSRFLYPRELEDLHEKHGLKTVVSLLHIYPNGNWLGEEKEACRNLGINFQHIPAENVEGIGDIPHTKQLIETFKECEYPMLVHCKDGSDRAGYASFLYLYAIKNVPFKVAKKQLSLKYGHVKKSHRKHHEFLKRFKDGTIDIKNLVQDCDIDVPEASDFQ